MSYIIGCVVTILELVHMDRQDVRWLRNLLMLLLVIILKNCLAFLL